jgi:hypothetical protein
MNDCINVATRDERQQPAELRQAAMQPPVDILENHERVL